jgi:hypothetical protein
VEPKPRTALTNHEDTISIADHHCDESSDRTTLLAIIDWEINARKEESQRPGWTKWAIFGALATVAWVFLNSLGAQVVSWPTVTAYVACLWMLIDLLGRCGSLIGNRTRLSQTLLLKTSYLASSRTQLVLQLLRSVFLLIAVLTILTFTWKPSMVAAAVWYGLGSLVFLVLTVMSFGQQPIAIPHDTGRRGWLRLTHLVPIGLLAIAVVRGPTSTLTSALTGTTLLELRLACLLVVACYLAYLALRDAADVPLLNELVSLRRNLAMERIDVESARKQLDLTMSGLRISDVMQKGVSRVIQYSEELSVSVEQATKTLSTLDSVMHRLVADPASMTPDDQTTTVALLEAANRQLGISEPLTDKLMDSIKKLSTGGRMWKVLAPDRAAEVDELIRDANVRRETISKKVKGLRAVSDSLQVSREKLGDYIHPSGKGN